MKKILYYLIFSLMFINYTFAVDEINLQANPTSAQAIMPSDELIKQIIEQYNLPQDQADELLQGVKAQLDKMKDSKELEKLMNIQMNSTGLPEIEKMDRNIESHEPQIKKRPKKYSNHPPLTRRSKLKNEY